MKGYRLKFCILLLVIVSVLYGSTYQQFRHLDMTDPRGADDGLCYIEMSHGNYNVDSVPLYRPLVPYAASFVQRALNPLIADSAEADKLSFYIVNFIITVGTALLFFGILAKLGFSWQLSMLGTVFFLSSRITVLSVGTPLVDSLYFFAIGAIVYMVLYEKTVLLACMCPLLVLSKETIIPFLFLPLAVRSMRNWKMIISIIFSLGVFYIFRHVIQQGAVSSQTMFFTGVVMHHVRSGIPLSFKWLCTPAGIHDLFNGFAFLAALAFLGLFLNLKYHRYKIPAFLLMIIPVAFIFGLLSGRPGRMFFSAYIPMIVYSLILIESCFEPKRNGPCH